MARRGRHDGKGATLPLNKQQFTALLKKHKEFDSWSDPFSYNERDPKFQVEIPVRKFSLEALKHLHSHLKGAGSAMGERWLMGQVGAIIKVMETKGSSKIEQLRSLENAMIAFIAKDIIHGWLFVKQGDVMQPMQVRNVYYVPPRKLDGGGTAPPFVTMSLGWFERTVQQTTHFTWHTADAIGKTVEEILAASNAFHETQEAVDAYYVAEKQFMEWRAMMGEQFVGQGEFDSELDEDGERDWHRKKVRRGDSEMQGTRLVVDDKCSSIENHNITNLFMGHKLTADDDDFADDEGGEINRAVEREADEAKAEKYAKVPLAFYIYCFNLSTYGGGWVHMDHMRLYVYKPELREKLVLSEAHTDLIDALTADMDILMEDIISGKSGGTTILCQGKAGTGKTLTAEVYAEVIKRPLYRIHSGQLGTSADSVEAALKIALENASRWRAVLLIDEADVFISQRGDDLEKNAVIGVFLRVLEYYSGLLFLTTNRVDTIDEAILSRCIAQIQYNPPALEERVKLWLTLGDVYGLQLVKDKTMARQLATLFDKATGRDIKGLIKLVTKYARQRNKKAGIDDFKRMAAFKGM